MNFANNNKTCINLNISYNKTTEVWTAISLGLWTDNNLNWKTHTEYIIPIVYFHSMLYGVIFSGNSNDRKKVTPKIKSLEQWKVLKNESLANSYL